MYGYVGKSFGPVWEEIRCSTLHKSPIMGEIAGVNTASLGGCLQSLKTRASSTMNSTATCSTWRVMSSISLYFAVVLQQPPQGIGEGEGRYV